MALAVVWTSRSLRTGTVAVAVGGVALIAAGRASAATCPSTPAGSAAVEWGINGVEQLGAGFRDNRENTPRTVLGLEGIRSVRAGFKFSLAVLADCSVVSWGSNTKLQLGNGQRQPSQPHPEAVVNLSQVQEVAAGNAHAMALEYDGSVWTWGASEFGERGNGESGFERQARAQQSDAVPRDEPTPVPGLEHVVQIASGGTADYALLGDGEVLAWGEDAQGALGIDASGRESETCYGEAHARVPVSCSTVPRPVKLGGHPLTGVEAIAAGEEAAYAVRDGGRQVIAWGMNGRGELGDGSSEPASSAVAVEFEPPSPVLEIAAGLHHALARLENGEVYGWGGDEGGQLGIDPATTTLQECGGKACATVPVRVPGLTGVVALAAGESDSLALKQEAGGKTVIYSFGSSGEDEVLGLGEPLQSVATPTPIEELPSVGGIAASATTGLAFLQAGTPPAPIATLASEPGGLTLTWSLAAQEFRTRYRPVGAAQWSKFADRPGGCRQEGSCHYQLPLGGLAPEPYEVALVAIPREGKSKTRYLTAAPLPPPGAPLDVALPALSPSPQVGESVTASSGSWSGDPTGFSYQWLRCAGLGEGGSEESLGGECEPIEGATSPSYLPRPGDVGYSLRVRVRAWNASGWSVALSANPEVVTDDGEEGLPAPPLSLAPPQIAGGAAIGGTLTVRPGSWEHAPTSFAYKWLSCRGVTLQLAGATCLAIAGAGGQSYTVTGKDAGRWIEVIETARNAGGYDSAVSAPVQVS